MEKNKLEHESFGLARFARISCGGRGENLFGSSIRHSNIIELEIKHAVIEERHGQDWYYDDHRKPAICKVVMSQAQFAELITSMNMGTGVPITLKQVHGESIQDCPFQNKQQQHSESFSQRMSDFAKDIEGYKADFLNMIEKRLPKKDQDEAKRALNHMIGEIKNNIPFFADQFTRQMEKTVTEAKGEVEAFVQNKITSAGLDALLEGKTNNFKMIE